MQLTIGGKKYTIVYTVAATMCDDLLETVVDMVKLASGERDSTFAIAGKLPKLTKILFYGGLLQIHGSLGDGDNTVKSKNDADMLLFQYLTENPKVTLTSLFNDLYKQLGDDNFLSRIGMTEEKDEPKPSKKAEKVVPIQTSEVGGES